MVRVSVTSRVTDGYPYRNEWGGMRTPMSLNTAAKIKKVTTATINTRVATFIELLILIKSTRPTMTRRWSTQTTVHNKSFHFNHFRYTDKWRVKWSECQTQYNSTSIYGRRYQHLNVRIYLTQLNTKLNCEGRTECVVFVTAKHTY